MIFIPGQLRRIVHGLDPFPTWPRTMKGVPFIPGQFRRTVHDLDPSPTWPRTMKGVPVIPGQLKHAVRWLDFFDCWVQGHGNGPLHPGTRHANARPLTLPARSSQLNFVTSAVLGKGHRTKL